MGYETLAPGLAALGLMPDAKAVENLIAFGEHLAQMNEVMNLTAITDPQEIVDKHFLDSATLFSTGLFTKGRTVIDVGCGAGFPGLPLKMLEPGLKITLLDSTRKKVDFIAGVIDRFGLAGAEALHARAEEAGQNKMLREKFDLATARGVAALPALCEYCLPFVKVGGFFVAMKGPSAPEEVEASKNALKTLGGTVREVKVAQIPGTELQHTLVVVEKTAPTPKAYPRRTGTATKKPL